MIRLHRTAVGLLIGCVALFCAGCARVDYGPVFDPDQMLSAKDVVWNSPSENAAGSMPIGNGEFGANVWVEAGSGDLMLLLSRTDAISEASRFLKLGRLRVTMTPGAMTEGGTFRQRLNLAAGRIEIDMGGQGDRTHLEVYFHPDADVMFITGRSDQARSVRVTLENWRTERRRLTGSGPDAELTSSWTMRSATSLPPHCRRRRTWASG